MLPRKPRADRREVAAEVKAILAQRLLRETAAHPGLYDSIYVRLADECERWAGEQDIEPEPEPMPLKGMQYE